MKKKSNRRKKTNGVRSLRAHTFMYRYQDINFLNELET